MSPEPRLLPFAASLYRSGVPLTEEHCRLIRHEAERELVETLKAKHALRKQAS